MWWCNNKRGRKMRELWAQWALWLEGWPTDWICPRSGRLLRRGKAFFLWELYRNMDYFAVIYLLLLVFGEGKLQWCVPLFVPLHKHTLSLVCCPTYGGWSWICWGLTTVFLGGWCRRPGQWALTPDICLGHPWTPFLFPQADWVVKLAGFFFLQNWSFRLKMQYSISSE